VLAGTLGLEDARRKGRTRKIRKGGGRIRRREKYQVRLFMLTLHMLGLLTLCGGLG
jgi:hypothetical protein